MSRIYADLTRALDYLDRPPSEADAWDMEQELRAGRGFDPERPPVTRSIGLERAHEPWRCGFCDGYFPKPLPPMIIGAEKYARTCRQCLEGMQRLTEIEALQRLGIDADYEASR